MTSFWGKTYVFRKNHSFFIAQKADSKSEIMFCILVCKPVGELKLFRIVSEFYILFIDIFFLSNGFTQNFRLIEAYKNRENPKKWWAYSRLHSIFLKDHNHHTFFPLNPYGYHECERYFYWVVLFSVAAVFTYFYFNLLGAPPTYKLTGFMFRLSIFILLRLPFTSIHGKWNCF